MITDTIKNSIQNALKALDIEVSGEIELEHPADLSHGDYSSNIGMVLHSQFIKEVNEREPGKKLTGLLKKITKEGNNGKKAKFKPRELAEEIVAELEKDLPEEIESVEVAGPGFINFQLSPTFFAQSLEKIQEKGDEFGGSALGADQTVVVEYSSPNIAKPFSVGHLRSTVIGDALANILAFSGYSVVRDNHLGDWGTQFGKVLYALDAWGDIEELESSDEPVKKLFELYVRFHNEVEENEGLEDEAREWFARLEAGDEEARTLLDKLTAWSLNAFDEIYDRLGISFDTRHGESKFAPMAPVILADLEAKDLLTENDGAKLVFFEDEDGEELMPPLMIEKSDGTTIYAARDLATDKWRKEEYGENVTIINEVGAEQSLYFKQLFETEELLGYFPKSQRFHLAHGLFRFKDGKMSTRKGNVVWLEDIIDEAVQRAQKFNEDEAVAEMVGIGAIKYNDLKRDPIKDIVFDWDEVLNLEGDSGPYLQYTHARAQAVLRKARETGVDLSQSVQPDETTTTEKLLYRFPEVVARAAKDHAPRYVAGYLHELAQAFNSFYGNTQIISDEPEAGYRLSIAQATAQVLENGLRLLGIKAPEEM